MKIIPTPAEIAAVKGKGFLRDKTTENCFNARVITVNGKITAEKMMVIAQAAQRFGNGEAAFTSRQTVEIQKIPFENIEPLCAFLAQYGLETGGTGPKVRPVVSCKGTTCVFGLIDTYGLSEAVHERFYKGYRGFKLPHKFKIAVGGCPNNCVKPDLNDVGVIGQRVPCFDTEICKNCKKCQLEQICPIGAVKLSDGTLVHDARSCNNCGRCMGKCPFGVSTQYTDGYAVYIGGRWGKQASRGRRIDHLFTDADEVLDFIEKCLLFFRENGEQGERFADTINRIGFENTQKQLLSDDLLTRKYEIIEQFSQQ